MRYCLLLLTSFLIFTSCFTGVESTKRVELSKGDMQASLPSSEDNFISQFKGDPIDTWEKGKEFVGLDNKVALIFDSRTMPSDPISLAMQGKTISFQGIEIRITPTLDTARVIVFADSARQYYYELKQPLTNSLGIPMLSDKRLVERLDSALRGKTLWVRSSVWHNSDTVSMEGMKFVPVKVVAVTPGHAVYPIHIVFTQSGREAWLPVSLGEAGPAARNFGRQFSLSDPRLLYPNINNETWEKIQRQEVAYGMTKVEARLAMGNPTDVSQGHNSAMLYELWQYPNGSYLIFEDGILTRYKISKYTPH